MSQEYISALVILIVSTLKVFDLEIASEAVEGLIVGLLALWIAIRRYTKGDITVLGVKKHNLA
jgi:hypothetical protein